MVGQWQVPLFSEFFSYKGLKYAHGALGGDAACHDQQLSHMLYTRKPARLSSASSTLTIITIQETVSYNTLAIY